MINFADVKKNIKEHILNWSHTPDYSCRILIFGGSGSEKKNKCII